MLHREDSIIDGSPQGLLTYFFPSGARKGVKYFDANVKAGLWQWWYENGQIREEGYWKQFAESDQ